jgi:glycosyltransferase involved in cell wall biosynthesis
MVNNFILVSYNAKLGMKSILDIYVENLPNITKNYLLTDKLYQSMNLDLQILNISSSKNHLSMFLDAINILKISKILYFLFRIKTGSLYILSSHPLNVVTALLCKILNVFPLFKFRVVSHIHDVKPHGNTKNEKIIDLVQKVQVSLSNQVTVYGPHLYQIAKQHFKLSDNKLFSYVLGVQKTDFRVSPPSLNTPKKYISLVGRIDKYKGIDVFIKIARNLQHTLDYEFIIAGSGDLSDYLDEIENLHNLTIINRFLSEDEMDDILQNSFILVLPYHDASQSAMVPLAYYNACPVIVSNVGGLPEAVVDGKTGFVVEPGDVNTFSNQIQIVCQNHSLQYSLSMNSFKYYQDNLVWSKIINNVFEGLFRNIP